MGNGQPLVGTRFTRGLAIAGIVIGVAGIIGLGLLAWWNYDGWKKGRDRYPFISWYVAWLGIVGVLHFTITLIVVGPHRVWNYGGIGTAVMVVGAFLATDATWYYDQVRAEFPTLKTRKAA
jgi:hypothetical protein